MNAHHSNYEIGTRSDPHAQIRAARRQPLLLHSLSSFREIFTALFRHRDISTVVEVGVESGAVSAMYSELGASAVFCIEPSPSDELRRYLDGCDALNLVTRSSPEALADLPIADLYVLDGDHNYAVVRQELDWILTHAPDAIVVLHDVLWPCSRRDLYYEPSTLPAEKKHPASEDGPTVWHDALTPAGFVGQGRFLSALDAGGERNGVLTAVEDALAETEDDPWHLELIPAIFGLGIMVRDASPAAADLIRSLRPYSSSTLLATMENNRIALYTRVLQLQYEAAAHADDAAELTTLISQQKREIEVLKDDLETAQRQVEEAKSLRRGNLRLTQEPDHQRKQARLSPSLKRFAHRAAAPVSILARHGTPIIVTILKGRW